MATSEKGRKAAMNKLLPMLAVFSEWASAHFHYMLTYDSPAAKDSSEPTDPAFAPTLPPSIVASISQQFGVSKDLLRTEVRARSGMR